MDLDFRQIRYLSVSVHFLNFLHIIWGENSQNKGHHTIYCENNLLMHFISRRPKIRSETTTFTYLTFFPSYETVLISLLKVNHIVLPYIVHLRQPRDFAKYESKVLQEYATLL